MADEMTPGEMYRAVRRLEEADRSLGDRITETSRQMIPAPVYAAELKAIVERIDHHERDAATDQARLEQSLESVRRGLQGQVAELKTAIAGVQAMQEKRSELTWTRVLGLIMALLALAALIVGVLQLSGGVH